MPPSKERRPFPDVAHESLAIWVEEAIDSLGSNRADTDDSFMLVDVLFAMVEDAIAQRDALRIRCDALHIRCDTAISGVDALITRVAALEEHHVPLPGPDAAG
jgi:hypothetical protein